MHTIVEPSFTCSPTFQLSLTTLSGGAAASVPIKVAAAAEADDSHAAAAVVSCVRADLSACPPLCRPAQRLCHSKLSPNLFAYSLLRRLAVGGWRSASDQRRQHSNIENIRLPLNETQSISGGGGGQTGCQYLLVISRRAARQPTESRARRLLLGRPTLACCPLHLKPIACVAVGQSTNRPTVTRRPQFAQKLIELSIVSVRVAAAAVARFALHYDEKQRI